MPQKRVPGPSATVSKCSGSVPAAAGGQFLGFHQLRVSRRCGRAIGCPLPSGWPAILQRLRFQQLARRHRAAGRGLAKASLSAMGRAKPAIRAALSRQRTLPHLESGLFFKHHAANAAGAVAALEQQRRTPSPASSPRQHRSMTSGPPGRGGLAVATAEAFASRRSATT